MVEISNSDTVRILQSLSIAEAHYKSLKGLRNRNQARLCALLREKILRKITLKDSQRSK